jgi:hypothetical protein
LVRLIAAVCLVLCWSTNAFSQIVRGTVVDESTNAPLPGVFVVLLDSAGRMRGGTLTDQKGFYAMRAPSEGPFTLRAERIGHRSVTTAPFALNATQAQTVDLRVPVAAIALAPIEVSAGAKRCEARGEQGRRTAQLWEEARKALTVTQWVKTERPFRFESRSYVRDLDPYSLEIRTETMRYGVSSMMPYRAISPDSLARFGFVQTEGRDFTYYGPDAEVLLSDIFLEQHCFRAVDGTGSTAGMIGLAFEPVRDRELRDITGTLWLDAKTFELRFIDYRYTNLPPIYNQRMQGGRTDFRRLSNGAWIVDKWYIRMPIPASGVSRQVAVSSVREEGGEVVSITDPQAQAQVQQLANDGAVRGSVYDSVRGQPLANATVYLSGTSYRATTDEKGSYVIASVPEGRYVIAFAHPVLDSLPAFPLPRSVTVQTKDTAQAILAIAAVRTQMANKCQDASRGGALFGYVTDSSGSRVSRAEVIVKHKRTRPRADGISMDTETLSVRTDEAGRYFLCSLPLDASLDVSVEHNQIRTREISTQISSPPFKRLDLVLR